MRHKIILTLWMFFVCVSGPAFSCTMILVGKDAGADGSVLLAHNNDLPGHIASMIQIVPAETHKPGSVIRFKNGLEIPQAAQTFRMLMMNCYYGFAEGDAKAINQYQVAIAGGTSLKADRSDRARELDPLVKNGVSGYIRYIALQRAKTARECIQLIGEIYSTYGISYPSGVGVADPNEIWYLEAGGGKCWAAQRVPDNHYLVAVNSYRIGNIDFNDKENFILPPYLKSYAIKKGLWKPGKKPFNFAEIFGGRVEEKGERRYYNARRVWRAQQLLTPSVKQNPDAFTHPWTLTPDKKPTVNDLISVMRDYYRGTEFDISQNTHIPPLKRERAIAVFNTVHAGVIQLRGHMPVEYGAVLWGGLSSALTTPYVPYYYGIQTIPQPYTIAAPTADAGSAFWQFRALTILLEPHLGKLTGNILPVWQRFEQKLFRMQAEVERTASALYQKDKQLTVDFLTFYSNGLALQALEMAKKIQTDLQTTLAKTSNK